MLRCSTLTLAIAFCFICNPILLGQTQYSAGFPSRLNDALAQSSTAETKSSGNRIQQRPWLGELPVESNFSRAQTRSASAWNYGTSQSHNQTAGQSKFNAQDVKGTPFKPTRRFHTTQPTRPTNEHLRPIQEQSRIRKANNESHSNFSPSSNFAPKSSNFVPKSAETPQLTGAPQTDFAPQQKNVDPAEIEPNLESDSNLENAFNLETQSEPQTVAALEVPATNTPAAIAPPKPQLGEVDPNIRREIEEQVKRDLEKKFESQIQDLVKKQVREQVNQARQKMERTNRNRYASRPLSSSSYRAPNRNRGEAPIITGEILPLIVPGNSASPKSDQNHARYLLTDGLPSNTGFQPKFKPASDTGQTVTPPPIAPPNTNRRDLQAAEDLLRDMSQVNPKSDIAPATLELEPEDESESNAGIEAPSIEAPVYQAQSKKTPTAGAQSTSDNLQPPKPFLLRTSVVGPEALLEGQSDDYEITISNIANRPATDIIVQLSVPNAITISRLDRDAYLDQKQRTVSWKVPVIGAGQKEVIKYRAISSSTGEYEQEVTLGMENTFQGTTPFITIVQTGAPQLPVDTGTEKDYVEVAERLNFDD